MWKNQGKRDHDSVTCGATATSGTAPSDHGLRPGTPKAALPPQPAARHIGPGWSSYCTLIGPQPDRCHAARARAAGNVAMAAVTGGVPPRAARPSTALAAIRVTNRLNSSVAKHQRALQLGFRGVRTVRTGDGRGLGASPRYWLGSRPMPLPGMCALISTIAALAITDA
jgi:hypothetical protein